MPHSHFNFLHFLLVWKRKKKLGNFFMGNHTVFLVQFGINLHEWVFQKGEIVWAASPSAMSAFWKTYECKVIPNWTRKTLWLLINNTGVKNIRSEKAPEVVSGSHFFRIWENVFQSFHTKFLSLLYMISLAYKISHCLSANHNPKVQCVICTGVTLFALVNFTLELHCSQPMGIK